MEKSEHEKRWLVLREMLNRQIELMDTCLDAEHSAPVFWQRFAYVATRGVMTEIESNSAAHFETYIGKGGGTP